MCMNVGHGSKLAPDVVMQRLIALHKNDRSYCYKYCQTKHMPKRYTILYTASECMVFSSLHQVMAKPTLKEATTH